MTSTTSLPSSAPSALTVSAAPPSPAFDTMAAGMDSSHVGTTSSKEIDRLSMAHDASHYLLVPQGIVRPESADGVAAVMAAASRAGLPVTFRSGGTSLSGQAVSDGVMVDTRRAFRGI